MFLAGLPVFAFFKDELEAKKIAKIFPSTAKFTTKYSERFLSICGEKIYLKAF